MNPILSRRIGNIMDIIMSISSDTFDRLSFVDRINSVETFDQLQKNDRTLIEQAEKFVQNSIQKMNSNCKQEEKVGHGPGSCGGASKDSKSQDTGPTAKTKLIPITTKFSEEPTDSESDSLRSYSTDSYSYISAFLNTGDASKASGSTFSSSNKDLAAMAGWIESLNFNEDNVKGAIYHIDNAMQKSKTNLDGIVYSGLGKEKNVQIANMKVGDTTTFKGYTSASKRLNVTGFFVPQGLEKNIVLKIRVPKGTNAIDMEKFANQENRKQYEVLLHKGITYKKVGEKEGSVSYRGTKIPVSIVEVEVTNPIDDSPRIDWKPDTMTSSEHKKEYDNSWKSAYDSVENGMKSITIPEKMADPFRRYKTRTISVGDEIEYTPDMYSESKTSKIVGFKPTTEKTPNGKIAYKVDAVLESGRTVDLSKHRLNPAKHNSIKQNSIESIAQKAFEIALNSGTNKIKLNWNCKDSEKNGTGPGSCSDNSSSRITGDSAIKHILKLKSVQEIQKFVNQNYPNMSEFLSNDYKRALDADTSLEDAIRISKFVIESEDKYERKKLQETLEKERSESYFNKVISSKENTFDFSGWEPKSKDDYHNKWVEAIGGLPTDDGDHYYHATTIDRLNSIKKSGLVPRSSEPNYSKDINPNTDLNFFSDSVDRMEYWSRKMFYADYDRTDGKLSRIPIILRTKKDSVPNVKEVGKKYEFRTKDSVAPEKLQVWSNGKWMNLGIKQNSILQRHVQDAFESALRSGATKIKFNANCPESEKVGSGPGSCGGKTLEKSLYSSLSKKSQATMKKYKMKGELKKAKTSIMASLVKSTKDEKSALENAKINASIFKGMTAEEADELTGDAAQEHTNWLMDKGPYYDIKQGISEPMLEDTEELHRRGWNVNGTYHPDIPKKSILDDAAAKIFTYKDEQGRFRKNAELIDAIEEYTGDLYDMYNKVSAGNLPQEFLNLTPEDQKDLKDRIDNFAAALNSAKLPEPVVTYRGIRETTLKRLEQLGATEVGSEFQVNYFQSTTLNYETTKSFLGKDSKGRNLRIQIKLPKGAPAAYVDGFSANNGEDEVLVNRNLKYRCVDVKENDATKTLVWEAII